MNRKDKVVYLRSDAGSDLSAGHAAYGRVRQQALLQLADALSSMLDSADDALFERAEKAENSQVQGSFFMAMRQLRLRRRELEQEFRAAMEGSFEQLRTGGRALKAQPAPAVDESEFSLIDNEELEETIAIDGMIAKIRTREMRRLSRLQSGFGQLFPRQRVDEHNNSLDPAHIVNAFVSSAAELELELEPRLVLYKLFDTKVLAGSGKIYEEAERLLAQAGVRLATARLPTTSAASAAASPRPDGLPAAAAAGLDAQGALPLLEGLQQLLVNEAIVGFGGLAPGVITPSLGHAPIAAGAAASLTDLVVALSQMQRGAGSTGAAGVKQALGQLLAHGDAERKQIGALEDAAIDIVGMLFDVILDDPQLPTRIKALIARLQIPVLKVALLDGAFFNSKQHPARRLINEMAQAAMGWVEPAQLERDPLYARIDYTVERILEKFDDDVQLFSDLLDDFLIFLEEEQERVRLVEERTRQAAEGKARVDAEIQQRTAGCRLPAAVQQLLDDAWSKVLVLSCLKNGEESVAWQQQLDLVDRLIASVQPRLTAKARRELLREIPALLQDLRDGLNAILFNPSEMARLFEQLEAEHVRCLNVAEQQDPGAVTTTIPVPTLIAPERPVLALPEPEDGLAEYLLQLDEVGVGAWFEFVQADEGRIRAKLSARLDDGRQLVFVNRSGFKLADRSRAELAADLRDGKATLLDDNLLFDKALEAVIANLRHARANG